MIGGQEGPFLLPQVCLVNLQCQVEIERPTTSLFWMRIDFPRLVEGVRLDEVALVMDVKAVLDGVILQIGHESVDVDCCHVHSGC